MGLPYLVVCLQKLFDDVSLAVGHGDLVANTKDTQEVQVMRVLEGHRSMGFLPNK